MAKKPQVYRTYHFKDRDPILERIETLRIERDMTFKDLSEKSGVSCGTFGNWRRKTRRPQFCTVMASLRAMGADLQEVPFSLRKK